MLITAVFIGVAGLLNPLCDPLLLDLDLRYELLLYVAYQLLKVLFG
jgi:hypothetical protein